MELVRYMISDAAKKIDVEPHVLRYWEDELAVEIPRNEMGHRYYREEEIGMMKGVKYLKEKGFQLKSIKILLPDIKKVMGLEQRRLLELRDRLELAVSQEELRLQREEELRQCGEELREEGQGREEGIKEEDQLLQNTEEGQNSIQGEKEDTERADTEKAGIEKADRERTDKGKSGGTGKEREKRQEKKEELQNYSRENIENKGADKLRQFRMMMNEIILEAMSENNRLLSDNITESLSKELEYQIKRKELLEEERFKQLDRTLREYQQGQKQAAVAKEYSSTRRKSKFFKKNKVRI